MAEGLLAISNGPEIGRESLGDGRVRVRFGATIPMSTYLVAWVVGPLELTEPVDAGGVAVRVAHVPGKAHLTRFALDIGAFAIQFFADYYGIPYPGEKCDLVALPDFSFGAMENLGCVTFREARLLLDPDQVTLSEMSDAALTIVHEIAHMWFGDLVTMKWWNGIWLNEAFATFMEHLGVDAYNAAWKTWDDFALGRAAALDVDALANTRTVEYEVITPEDADGMFDVLTYQKGGSVLRMLERWLGADAFRAGVRAYLDRYQLANTETTDLWDSLESATSSRCAGSWTRGSSNPAYPLVTAERDGDRVTISQQRFSYEAPPARRSGRSRCARVSKAKDRRKPARSSWPIPRSRSRSPPARSSCSTPVARASTASRTRRSGAPARRRGRARTARAVLAHRRLLGFGARGTHPGRGAARPRPSLRRRRRARRLACS